MAQRGKRRDKVFAFEGDEERQAFSTFAEIQTPRLL
jgi:hypothetical protein